MILLWNKNVNSNNYTKKKSIHALKDFINYGLHLLIKRQFLGLDLKFSLKLIFIGIHDLQLTYIKYLNNTF